jgi:heterodisulfide reductase subunit D
MRETFETSLQARVDTMVDACTRCGKCVEVCPATGAAGVSGEPSEVIGGIIDILRLGEGNEAARKWRQSTLPSQHDPCRHGAGQG